MFSREYLERLGAETGFRPDTLEKVLRLERVLTGIRRHPFLGERLVLKGGTALNLFFGGPVPRLSVDLDLNYVYAATAFLKEPSTGGARRRNFHPQPHQARALTNETTVP